MEYTRLLKEKMSGADVLYMKQLLFWLKYYDSSINKLSSSTFGSDTTAAVKLFQKKNKNKSGKALKIDGKIGDQSWWSIENAGKNAGYVYNKQLKQGSGGKDVKFIKDRLLTLRYYTTDIKKISDSVFDSATLAAVKLFQKNNKDDDGKALTVDGIVGEKTFDAIRREASYGNINKNQPKPTPTPTPTPKPEPGLLDKYTWISESKRKAIEADLKKASSARQKICLDILKLAYDVKAGGNVRALYVWGANLYQQKATAAYIKKRADAAPKMFTGGRKEWMLDMVKKLGEIWCSDCSGMEVGYLRKFGYVDAKFDESANTLCSNSHSTKISRSALKPGDWVHKDGHIGTYVGGGYVVEFYGGAYGCQLTQVDDRQGYDFIKKKVEKGGAWTNFRDPKYY